MTDDLHTRIKKLLPPRIVRANPGELTQQCDLRDLGMDSMAMIVFWLAFEREFGVKLERTVADLARIRTYGELVAKIAQAVSASRDLAQGS